MAWKSWEDLCVAALFLLHSLDGGRPAGCIS
jgi:hypothetical protein